VGNQNVAIDWLNKNGNGKTTARVLIRSLERLGTPPSFKKFCNLGAAELKSGLDVAATPAPVAATFVREGNLRLKRFEVERYSLSAAVEANDRRYVAHRRGGLDRCSRPREEERRKLVQHVRKCAVVKSRSVVGLREDAPRLAP
jgi:hypothetical protein